MELILGNYKAEPYGSTCWQIKKRAGEEAKREWNDVGFYPTTLADAMARLWELAVADAPGLYDLSESTVMLREVERLKAEAVDAAKKAGEAR